MKAPCKDCPNRQIGCHSTCEKYLEFRKEVDRLKQERIAKRDVDQYVRESITKNYMITFRKKRR